MKKKLFSQYHAVWGWEANCAWYGDAQSRWRQRHLRITAHKLSVNTPSQVPILLRPIQLPKTIREYLKPLGSTDVITGTLVFYETMFGDVHNPALLGSITHEKVSQKTVPTRQNHCGDTLLVSIPQAAKLKFFSVDSPIFSLGKYAAPAGFGHALLFGPRNSFVRRLSTIE